MKNRSPLLGYNHNIRYGGRLYHVQTEDSGLNNPHLFTHLFHGGTILASKRSNYSATDEDALVQKQMQLQHKAMLKELRAGAFDERIEKFFGEPVQKGAPEPGAVALEGERTAPSPRVSAESLAAHPARAAHPEQTRPDPHPAGAMFPDIDIDMNEAHMPGAPFHAQPGHAAAASSVPPAPPLPAAPPIDPQSFGAPRPGDPAISRRPMMMQAVEVPPDLAFSVAAPPRAPARPAPQQPAPVPVEPPQAPRSAFDLPPASPPAGRQQRHTMVFGSGVVIPPRRPANLPPPPGPPMPLSITPPPVSRGPVAPARAPDTIFGEDMEKSLDEVILAYLSEDPPEK